jgi:hypothetical protein
MVGNANADTLIGELVRKYAEMSSYQDEGVVLQALGEGEKPIETRFTTHFRRPDLFRFAFASPHPYPPLAHVITAHVCGADKVGAYSWTKLYEEPAQLENAKNISMAVAGATGISGGSAHTIGALLMREVGGFGLGQISQSSFLGEEIFEGADCVIIGALHPAGGELSLWIERNTVILRKLRSKPGPFPPSDEIRRSISIDKSIEDRVFERPNGET